MYGVISFTVAFRQMAQYLGQRQQVNDLEERPPSRHHNKWVRPGYVRPTRRNRLHVICARPLEEDAMLAPGVRVPEQLELLADLRMVRMGDPESSRKIPSRSSRRLTPRAKSRPWSAT